MTTNRLRARTAPAQAAASRAPVAAGWLLAAALAPGWWAPADAQTAAPTPDLDAGKARVDAVCAACHGANGVSVAAHIPHLAGQHVPYLEAQLRALKSGLRPHAVMGPIAAQLDDADIVNVAAWLGSLPPPYPGARSEPLPALTATRATLPADFRATFTRYATVSRPDLGQVRYLWANAVALQAARDGRPMPSGAMFVLEQHATRLDGSRRPVVGVDGHPVSERLLAFTVMGSGVGWGDAFPEMLRNGDWNFGVFGPDMQPRAGASQAECLACHKPLDKSSFLFSLAPLTTFAKGQ